jgi:hypothetical protein
MANPEHVTKLKEGKQAWNAWRLTNDEKPDLSGLALKDFSLRGYDLVSANFSDAENCSFERAVIFDGVFIDAELSKCNFRDAMISDSTFSTCTFDQSDFTDATLMWSSFANLSLRSVRGLDALNSSFTNSIGIDTFFKSGGLPETFLRDSGVPEEFIEYASSLIGKAIEYFSCFLSHSSKDDDFTRRLYNDLLGKNIRTWFAPEDLKIGDRFRSRIDESIRIHDKLVIILSANSVNSDWVETEVASALEREQKEGKDVLFPIAIDEEGFTSNQPWAADIRRKRHIGDFRKWKSHDDYTAAFDRLVRDLKKSQPPIIMKGG